jgi:hypothetical protein
LHPNYFPTDSPWRQTYGRTRVPAKAPVRKCDALASRASLQQVGGSPVQQVERTVVMLEATRDVELRPGLVLPPGLYSGTETYTHLVGSG